MRSNFESERKAHRKNLYDSIMRDDHRSVEISFDMPCKMHSEPKGMMDPRWNKSLMKNFNTKRRLFETNHNYANYSTSVPHTKESDFEAG